jgi:Bacterial Ig-like domain (group 3)
VPSPATTTSYGATGSTAEGFFVQQVYADGTTNLWRSPNDTTRPGEEAPGLVRTVAGTQTPTQTTLQVVPVAALHLAVSVVTVSPQDATGTIQLKDGTTTIGGPEPVTDGFAIIIRPLPPGPHSLTANFTPRHPRKFGSSTSNTVTFTL